MSVTPTQNTPNIQNQMTDEDKAKLEEFLPNYDFIKTREMTIKDFFNTLFVQFGLYRAAQRIPRLDGLAETQRKILWTAIKKNYKKKEKLDDVMADVRKVSNYHHGPASLADTMNNLIAPYKNNLPFFKPEGSFGSRNMRAAAATRYTQTRNTPYVSIMFPEEDIIATWGYRSADGAPAEPLTLYPILPLSIINGQVQTSIGFATKILPRDPMVILDLFMGILTGTTKQIPAHIPPIWPFYKGKIELTGPNSWESIGLVEKSKKGKKNIVKVLEVPFNWDNETMVKHFMDLKDAGVIDNFIDGSNDQVFEVEIYGDTLFALSEENIIKKLGLTSSITESFTYITSDNNFEVNCKSIASYINYFLKERLKVYEARRVYRLAKIMYEIRKITATINYINEVNAGRIEIRNKEEEEIIEQISKYAPEYLFEKMSKSFVYLNPKLLLNSSANVGYDYLFDFSVKNFTPKRLKYLGEQYTKLIKEYDETSKITAIQLWIEDLQELKKSMLKNGWNK